MFSLLLFLSHSVCVVQRSLVSYQAKIQIRRLFLHLLLEKAPYNAAALNAISVASLPSYHPPPHLILQATPTSHIIILLLQSTPTNASAPNSISYSTSCLSTPGRPDSKVDSQSARRSCLSTRKRCRRTSPRCRPAASTSSPSAQSPRAGCRRGGLCWLLRRRRCRRGRIRGRSFAAFVRRLLCGRLDWG